MDKAVIITGGEEVSEKTLNNYIDDNTYVICADKGGETALRYGIRPDIILGDFDSIEESVINRLGAEILEFPSDKDYTDTELAVEHAVKNGYKEITVMNATGDRPDHELANFMLMVKYKECNLRIAGNNFISFLLKENMQLENKKNMLFSLIPVCMIKGLSLEGFRYELRERNVKTGESLCISNIITSDAAKISLSEGMGIVIINKPEICNEKQG